MTTSDTDNSHAAATVTTYQYAGAVTADASPTVTTMMPGGDTVTKLATVTTSLV